ncbi:MAG TPA: hypothetical protein VNT26_16125 [Candidatus Sulfotelmatobacter sp.]|nr:hypothetical protein [Candidatus Sulfotelmatobacter sp.]
MLTIKNIPEVSTLTYDDLHIAVLDAHRKGSHLRSEALMDQYIQTAMGADLGKALCLKANYLMLIDPRRSAEGLSLIEDAMLVAEGDSDLQMKCIIAGLGLCYMMGDVRRAARYESLAHQLLMEYAGAPSVYPVSCHLCFNLAHIDSLKQEHTQAYWHLVQGTRMLLAAPGAEADEARCMLFKFYLRTAEVCLQLDRSPEGEDALNKARAYTVHATDELLWQISWAEHLLATKQPERAAQVLDELTHHSQLAPATLVRFHLTRGLAAQALGDFRAFHHHLAKAQLIAVNHAQDHLLGKIQRVMRTPARLEAIR